MFPKSKRLDDGSFDAKHPPSKQCIMCGIWYPGHIERHHGKSKGSGGNSTWLDRFDVCVGPPNDCHGKAQTYAPGYLLADLEKARQDQRDAEDLYSKLVLQNTLQR